MVSRSSIVGTGVLAAVLTFIVAPLDAQERYEAIAVQRIAAAPNLQVITIRDRVLNTCYTTFAMDQRRAARESDALDLQHAAALRDQRLAELKVEFEQSMVTLVAGMSTPNPLTFQWEADKAQFDFLLSAMTRTIDAAVGRLEDVVTSSRLAVAQAVPCPDRSEGPPQSESKHIRKIR